MHSIHLASGGPVGTMSAAASTLVLCASFAATTALAVDSIICVQADSAFWRAMPAGDVESGQP
jgi:hypothetical protein